MGLVPNLVFMRIHTKSPKFSQRLNYNEWCRAIETGFLACPTRMGGPKTCLA